MTQSFKYHYYTKATSSKPREFSTQIPLSSGLVTMVEHEVAAPLAFTFETEKAAPGSKLVVPLRAGAGGVPDFGVAQEASDSLPWNNSAGTVNHVFFEFISDSLILYRIVVPSETIDGGSSGGGIGDFSADGSTPMTGALNMGSNKVTDAADPTNPQDLATKAYVDANSGGIGNLKADGSVPATGDLPLGGFKLTGVADPTLDDDAATKSYVDTAASGNLKQDGSVAATGNLSLGTNQLTNVADPTSAQDAATKSYVDTVAASRGKTDYDAANIAARDLLAFTEVGETVFVTDATADATVDTGWAIYRVSNLSPLAFIKLQEQESMDVAVAGVPSATDTAEGTVELATDVETVAGTDTSRAATSSGVKAAIDDRVADGADVTAGTAGKLVDAAQLKAVADSISSSTGAQTVSFESQNAVIAGATPTLPAAPAEGDIHIEVYTDAIAFYEASSSGWPTSPDATYSPAGGSSSNIYDSSGTLTSARSISLDGNTLSIIGERTAQFFDNGRVRVHYLEYAPVNVTVATGDSVSPAQSNGHRYNVIISNSSTGDVAFAQPSGYSADDELTVRISNVDSVDRTVTFASSYADLPSSYIMSAGERAFFTFRFVGGSWLSTYSSITQASTSSGDFLADGSVAMTGDLDAGSNKVTNVTDGTTPGDAVNFGQLSAIPAAIRVPVNLDVGGGATSSFPTGETAGKAYIIENAAPGGTALGAANPITVNNGDKLVAADGVTSSADDGSDWVVFANTEGVSSVKLGSSAAASGAVVVPLASETAEGLVELATTAEAIAGTDSSRAMTPAATKAVVDTLQFDLYIGDLASNYDETADLPAAKVGNYLRFSTDGNATIETQTVAVQVGDRLRCVTDTGANTPSNWEYVAMSPTATGEFQQVRVSGSYSAVLPAATGSGKATLYILNSSVLAANLTPQAGESINGLSGAPFDISTFGASSNVLLTDAAAGVWLAKVIDGEDTVVDKPIARMELTYDDIVALSGLSASAAVGGYTFGLPSQSIGYCLIVPFREAFSQGGMSTEDATAATFPDGFVVTEGDTTQASIVVPDSGLYRLRFSPPNIQDSTIGQNNPTSTLVVNDVPVKSYFSDLQPTYVSDLLQLNAGDRVQLGLSTSNIDNTGDNVNIITDYDADDAEAISHIYSFLELEKISATDTVQAGSVPVEPHQVALASTTQPVNGITTFTLNDSLANLQTKYEQIEFRLSTATRDLPTVRVEPSFTQVQLEDGNIVIEPVGTNQMSLNTVAFGAPVAIKVFGILAQQTILTDVNGAQISVSGITDGDYFKWDGANQQLVPVDLSGYYVAEVAYGVGSNPSNDLTTTNSNIVGLTTTVNTQLGDIVEVAGTVVYSTTTAGAGQILAAVHRDNVSGAQAAASETMYGSLGKQTLSVNGYFAPETSPGARAFDIFNQKTLSDGDVDVLGQSSQIIVKVYREL